MFSHFFLFPPPQQTENGCEDTGSWGAARVDRSFLFLIESIAVRYIVGGGVDRIHRNGAIQRAPPPPPPPPPPPGQARESISRGTHTTGNGTMMARWVHPPTQDVASSGPPVRSALVRNPRGPACVGSERGVVTR